MKIADLKKKKILILGFGREGRETLKWIFDNKITRKVSIADQKTFEDFDLDGKRLLKKAKKLKVKIYLGEDFEASFSDIEVIIKTPGISFAKIGKYARRGVKITSETEIFLDNCPSWVIGITGTKGKSTTSALIYHILKTAGFKTQLLGNIGIPPLSILPKLRAGQWCVYEMSSHQLDRLQMSPDISVFLNIYPEHLDYYKDFSEYFKAKSNIVLWQKKNGIFVYNGGFDLIAKLVGKTKASGINFEQIKISNFIEENDLPLPLEIYSQNIKAAIVVALALRIKEEKIVKALKTFKPLEHRMQHLGNFHGIDFYDDSLATIPEATIAAIKSLNGKVGSIILGGHDRKIKYDDLAQAVVDAKIKHIAFFPESGKFMLASIGDICKKLEIPLPNYIFADSMRQAVEFCVKNTPPGSVCLLSCASPSFGMFKDYKDRGEQFKNEIQKYQ